MLFFETSFSKTLILGDSLTCGSFGKELLRQIAKKDSNVVLKCAVSSRPYHWMKSENPKGIICQEMTSQDQKLRPCGTAGEMPSRSKLAIESKDSNVIIALGTNSLGSQVLDETYFKLAEFLSSKAETCRWVGPPHLNPKLESLNASKRLQIIGMDSNLDSFYKQLNVIVGSRCRVIDSRSATRFGLVGNGTIDGVHRKESAGKAWAQQIFPSL